MGEDLQEEQQLRLEHEQEGDEQHGDEQQEPAAQEDLHREEQGEVPVYAELEARPPLPQMPVRRPRSQRGASDPQLPTRSSRRFSGQDGPLESLPYSGRRI
jgi:hypothetical protein